MKGHTTKEKVTFASLLVAFGIIYGDIGTSPLYTFRAIIGEKAISEQLVLGAVSCIFWTLFLQTTVKYIWITLKADNEGEGGIFALYSLVRKFGKYLVIPTIIGASALLADGIICPSISVSSAIEGLQNLKGLEHVKTVPIVLIIISALFLFQRYGTHQLGKTFGPAMLIWFSMLAVLGIISILQFPSVLKALNPVYAYDLLVKYPGGFILLGGVFLATTGAEALYSDLGHCGRQNIRITWAFIKPCLVLNYMGQAAWIMNYGVGNTLGDKNPFYELMPSWFMIIGVIIATVATIIASQALISGSYTLINEAINLNLWPRVAIRQPSENKGQMYIPSINSLLWIGSFLIVIILQTSSNMEAAYGLSITITMLVTTYLLTFFLLYRLRWNKVVSFFFITLFATIEISFFAANIHKFPEGGYITIIMAILFSFIMYSVYSGRKISSKLTKYVELKKHIPLIDELSHDESIPKYATHLIYLSKSNRKSDIEEKSFVQFLLKNLKEQMSTGSYTSIEQKIHIPLTMMSMKLLMTKS